jgi:hypothetical protein
MHTDWHPLRCFLDEIDIPYQYTTAYTRYLSFGATAIWEPTQLMSTHQVYMNKNDMRREYILQMVDTTSLF